MRTLRTCLLLLSAAVLCAVFVSGEARAEWSLDFMIASERAHVYTPLDRAAVYRASFEGGLLWRRARPDGLALAVGTRFAAETEEAHHWNAVGEYRRDRRSEQRITGWTLMAEYTAAGASRAASTVYRVWMHLPSGNAALAAGVPRHEAAAALTLELVGIHRSDPVMLYTSVAPRLSLPVVAAGRRYRFGPEIDLAAGAVIAVTKDIILSGRLRWGGKLDDVHGADRVPATKTTWSALELSVGRTLPENVQVLLGARLALDRQGQSALYVGVRLH